MKWSDEEVTFLLHNYRSMSSKEIAEALGKSEQAVKSKMCRLKIGNDKRPVWTEKEVQVLVYHYHKGKDYVLELLPGRSWDSIRSKVRNLRKKGVRLHEG